MKRYKKLVAEAQTNGLEGDEAIQAYIIPKLKEEQLIKYAKEMKKINNK